MARLTTPNNRRLFSGVKGVFHIHPESRPGERNPAALGRALKAARTLAGLSQEDAAQAVGVTAGTLSRWERGTQAVSDEQFRALEELYVLEKGRKDLLALGDRDGIDLRPVLEGAPPQVMKGLSQPIRVFLQEFLLEITRAGASEHEVDAARRLLTSPELQTVWVGGQPRNLTDEEWLMGLRATADFIRAEMKKRGYKFPSK